MVTQWIISPQARHLDPKIFIETLIDRLAAEGFVVDRFVFTLRTMHPEVWLESVRWERDRGGYVIRREHSFGGSALFSESPVVAMYRGEPGFRRRLDGELEPGCFPILTELKEKGFTDHLIAPLELTPGFWSYVSCSTKVDGGFTEENLLLWDRLLPLLAVSVAEMSSRVAMASLLDVYVGEQASRYVRSGSFRRGDGESIDAVIWFCDLRGFTRYTDENPASAVLGRLDDYFDLVGRQIAQHGGEILKFIGDAILAIFRVDQDLGSGPVARAAIQAARGAIDELAAHKTTDGQPLEVGIGLHLGRVTFGNVGTARRLDFTVIGGPVNETARIEALCKELGAPVLMSALVAEAVQSDEVESMGIHTLRGTREQQELFTLKGLLGTTESR